MEPEHENTRRPIGTRGDTWHTLPACGVQQRAQGVYVEKSTRRKTVSKEKCPSVALFFKGQTLNFDKTADVAASTLQSPLFTSLQRLLISARTKPHLWGPPLSCSLVRSYSDRCETIEMTGAFWRRIWENYKTKHKVIKKIFLTIFLVFHVCLIVRQWSSLDLWILLNWNTHKDTGQAWWLRQLWLFLQQKF